MDFCKICEKWKHRVKSGRCRECEIGNKTKRKPEKIFNYCGRCSKPVNQDEKFCYLCNVILEKKGEKQCHACGSFVKKSKFQTQSECEKCYQSRYSKQNKGKKRSLQSKRRAVKLDATPNWLTTIDWLIIEYVYESCPHNFHIDHIVPLQGKTVCGLHVPWNLQAIPKLQNLSKSNRHWPDMW